MQFRTLLFTATAAAFLPVAPAHAANIYYYAGTFSGTNEVPANGSPGTGYVNVTFDTFGHTMQIQGEFSGLTGTVTVAHIHCCAALGVNAAVATTTPTFIGFPSGVTAGSFDLTYDMTLLSSYRPAFIAANGGTTGGAEAGLLAGLDTSQAYFNIHTNLFPGGEIRAQLNPVTAAIPEPASWLLMISGFMLLGAQLRTRTSRRLAFI